MSPLPELNNYKLFISLKCTACLNQKDNGREECGPCKMSLAVVYLLLMQNPHSINSFFYIVFDKASEEASEIFTSYYNRNKDVTVSSSDNDLFSELEFISCCGIFSS